MRQNIGLRTTSPHQPNTGREGRAYFAWLEGKGISSFRARFAAIIHFTVWHERHT
nr:MAG TPA: hypothetical protein [Caudoviricetes sp.]